MKVGTTLPEIGTVFDWDIEEILKGDSCDLGIYGDWEYMITCKRGDEHYNDVLESIRRWGFVRPLTAYHDGDKLSFGDGHHRLAAAMELGMTTVPVEVFKWATISEDSGEWDSKISIDSTRAVDYLDGDEWY